VRKRFRLALCALTLATMLVACSGRHVKLPFGIDLGTSNGIHQVGSWSVAASGDYQGHPWIRYRATASSGGICYSLQVDGKNAFGTPPGPPTSSGRVAWCGNPRVTTARRTGFVVQDKPSTSSDFGYVSGLVPAGSSVVATFDDHSTQTAKVLFRGYTLFFGPGRTLVALKTIDAHGKALLTCTVSPLTLGQGPPLLAAKC
jgi:hypothetical protein